MDEQVRRALATDRVIDITTVGRQTGLPRRIETWFFRVGDEYFLTGSPGRRGWYANLAANPEFTFHLKASVATDLPALAIPVTEAGARREILTPILRELGQSGAIESWIAGSPLVRVIFPGSDAEEGPS
jgi:deazaflavin-dependent oxidoreductase (nitroreductase family)